MLFMELRLLNWELVSKRDGVGVEEGVGGRVPLCLQIGGERVVKLLGIQGRCMVTQFVCGRVQGLENIDAGTASGVIRVQLGDNESELWSPHKCSHHYISQIPSKLEYILRQQCVPALTQGVLHTMVVILGATQLTPFLQLLHTEQEVC